MDLSLCVKELIEKVASLQTDMTNLKLIISELKNQQWLFLTAILGFLGKEIYHQFKNAKNKRNGNGGE